MHRSPLREALVQCLGNARSRRDVVDRCNSAGGCGKTSNITPIDLRTEATSVAPPPLASQERRGGSPPLAEGSAQQDPSPPLRPLASLRWPYVPEESAYPDPLKRDDPKPLQVPQYEAIGALGMQPSPQTPPSHSQLMSYFHPSNLPVDSPRPRHKSATTGCSPFHRRTTWRRSRARPARGSRCRGITKPRSSRPWSRRPRRP